MTEGTSGFLEHLYRGELRRELCSPDRIAQDYARAELLAGNLRQTLGQFGTKRALGDRRIPERLMKRMKEMGVFGILVPVEHGGLGFTIAECLRFMERLAAIDSAVCAVPLAHLCAGVVSLCAFGSEEQRRRYLPRAASGRIIFGLSLTEPVESSGIPGVRARARREEDGDAYILNCTTTYVANAGYAGAFVAFARTEPERPETLSAFIVERKWAGVEVGEELPVMGLRASAAGAVRMKEVRVPAKNLIGKVGDGLQIALSSQGYVRLALGASSVGLMSRSIEDMTARASKRRKFGVPLLDFELIRTNIARARAHEFAASAMVYFTASLLDRAPLSNVSLEASHAKLYSSIHCWDTLYEAMQTAGGTGYLSIFPYEKRMRDYRAVALFGGTTERLEVMPSLELFSWLQRAVEQRRRIGRWLLLRKFASRRILAGMKDGHPEIQRALKTALHSEKLLRSLLCTGFARFGSRIVAEELYLRRITRLSLSLFSLIASVCCLRGRYPNGDYPQDLLYLLRYLTAEAEEVQRSNGRAGLSPKEEAQSDMAAFISSARP